MKLYLAAQFYARDQMFQHRAELRAMGHVVTSRWIDQEGEAETNFQEPKAGRMAAMDLLDIRNSDMLVAFTDNPSSTGGYHFEMGYAIGTGKRVCVVGPLKNIFQSLDPIGKFADWKQFKQWLREYDPVGDYFFFRGILG